MNGPAMVAALDVGSSKVVCLIAEIADPTENGDGPLPRVVGMGVAPCDGLRKGMVVHLEKTVRAIEKAVHDAEVMADTTVDEMVVGISGEHTESLNSRGVIAVSEPHAEIREEDVEKVLQAARAVAIPLDREVLHVIPQGFTIDDTSGIGEPVGMAGVRLEADVHIITGSVTAIQNLTRAVEKAGFKVAELMLEPVASGLSTLEEDELELGVVLLDVGAGTTDLTIYHDGAVRASGVVALGGQQVTNDIAMGLRTPVARAERIKLEHGCALRELLTVEGDIIVPGVGGRPDRRVSHEVLVSIIGPRVEEIVRLARREALRSDAIDLVSGGIVVTGGCASLPGVCELAERIFELPGKLGIPLGVDPGDLELRDPRYSAAVGLLLHALESDKGTVVRKRRKSGGGIAKTLERVRSQVSEFLLG
jgi:cell division protein FtsA